jgi:predicted metalloprotease with PDZ domain
MCQVHPIVKVSIYTEGCLLALVTDVFILKNSNEKYSLDDVMKRLYFDFYLQNKGVSETDYFELVESLAGASFKNFIDDYFYNSRPFESILIDAFEYLGLEMQHIPSKSYSAAKLGFKAIPQNANFSIKAIYPGSPAELAGLMLEDEVLAVNDFLCNGELDKWLSYFDDDAKTITVMRKQRLYHLTLPEVKPQFLFRVFHF